MHQAGGRSDCVPASRCRRGRRCTELHGLCCRRADRWTRRCRCTPHASHRSRWVPRHHAGLSLLRVDPAGVRGRTRRATRLRPWHCWRIMVCCASILTGTKRTPGCWHVVQIACASAASVLLRHHKYARNRPGLIESDTHNSQAYLPLEQIAGISASHRLLSLWVREFHRSEARLETY